jgi:hypothetical protein
MTVSISLVLDEVKKWKYNNRGLKRMRLVLVKKRKWWRFHCKNIKQR